ncbi:carbohydrate ABC transporter permease [Paenibacillus yanchengensis]|uniref:Carbohydrate ABC transporter permease n=1 Tax=Paenibacillus yanchengensis TaxID=2035833 RepID=A0ABW4YPG9_9BACL
MNKTNKNLPYILLLAPALIGYVIFAIVPIFLSFFYSLTDFDGISSSYSFIGLNNYKTAFQDDRFFYSIKVTLLITVISCIVINVAALVLAMLLNSLRKLKGLFRLLVFYPQILSFVVVGFVWSYIYNYNTGVLNYVLQIMSLDSFMQDWLGDQQLVIFSIIFVIVWQSLGFYTVIYLAALQTVPQDVVEAATIDGASKLQQFKAVIFPLLSPSFTINWILCFISGLKTYDVVKVMTDGGPGFTTETIAFNIISQAFVSNKQGYASALAIILFLFVAAMSIVQVVYLRKREVEA